MDILDPDLWNDDGTPKRPSKEYMASLDAVGTFQAHAEELQRLVDETITVSTSEKPVIQASNGSYLNYARLRREAKAARSPEVGDIVHFWTGEVCRPAIVMETDSFGDGALLRVVIPADASCDEQTQHDEEKEFQGTWHWPCGEGR